MNSCDVEMGAQNTPSLPGTQLQQGMDMGVLTSAIPPLSTLSTPLTNPQGPAGTRNKSVLTEGVILRLLPGHMEKRMIDIMALGLQYTAF